MRKYDECCQTDHGVKQPSKHRSTLRPDTKPARCSDMAARRTFEQRTETFGYGTSDPWADSTIRLLFHTPRAYGPLIDGWALRYPYTRRALRQLVGSGFVKHQPSMIVNTVTGRHATQPGKPTERWRTTAKGTRLLRDWQQNPQTLHEQHPKTKPGNTANIIRLLEAFEPANNNHRTGVSVAAAVAGSQLAEKTGRWWVQKFEERKHIRRIKTSDGQPLRVADTRQVVPAHWRATRLLGLQLADLARHLPDVPATVIPEFRLRRSRYLNDIAIGRINPAGASDYEHDIETQRILAAMLRSPKIVTDAIFRIEPRITIPAFNNGDTASFDDNGNWDVFYQPDAEFRERHRGKTRRAFLEYERYQARRDAWAHIEKLCGYMHTLAHPSEAAVLYFVVDTPARQRTYIKLIEAFTDHAMDRAGTMPANETTLCVSTSDQVQAAADPLAPGAWTRIMLPARPADATTVPLLHKPDDSPYNNYFGRDL